MTLSQPLAIAPLQWQGSAANLGSHWDEFTRWPREALGVALALVVGGLVLVDATPVYPNRK